ncbi:MAG: hypothetical protein U0Q16_25010 [Bryobacteraceae bacterium]
MEFNALQFSLFDVAAPAQAGLLQIKGFVVWLLLIYVDPKTRQARAELSRPVRYEKQRPTHFDKRIILKPIDLDDTSNFEGKPGPSGPPSTPEVVVEIRRRA